MGMRKENIKRWILFLIFCIVVGIMYSCSVGMSRSINAEENDSRATIISMLNEAKDKTSKSEIFGAEAEVGATIKEGYKIRRNICEDTKNKIMHMNEYVLDTKLGTQKTLEYWFDVNKKFRYEYNKLRKQYMYTLDENGDTEKDLLSLDFYLEKEVDNYDPEINTKVLSDEYIINADKNIDCSGVGVDCKVISHISEINMKEFPSFDKTMKNSLFYKNALSGVEGKDVIIKIETRYYISKSDGRIYLIEIDRTKWDIKEKDDSSGIQKDENSEVKSSTYINFYYPSKSLNIPSKYKKNPYLTNEVFFNYKEIKYVTEYEKNKTVLKVYSCKNKKEYKKRKVINIPDYIKYNGRKYKVIAIDDIAFAKMKKLKKVTIGKNVKTIGANAFKKCNKLKQVYIKSKKISKIEKFAFRRSGGKKLLFYIPKGKYKKYKRLIEKSKTNKFDIIYR